MGVLLSSPEERGSTGWRTPPEKRIEGQSSGGYRGEDRATLHLPSVRAAHAAVLGRLPTCRRGARLPTRAAPASSPRRAPPPSSPGVPPDRARGRPASFSNKGTWTKAPQHVAGKVQLTAFLPAYRRSLVTDWEIPLRFSWGVHSHCLTTTRTRGLCSRDEAEHQPGASPRGTAAPRADPPGRPRGGRIAGPRLQPGDAGGASWGARPSWKPVAECDLETANATRGARTGPRQGLWVPRVTAGKGCRSEGASLTRARWVFAEVSLEAEALGPTSAALTCVPKARLPTGPPRWDAGRHVHPAAACAAPVPGAPPVCPVSAGRTSDPRSLPPRTLAPSSPPFLPLPTSEPGGNPVGPALVPKSPSPPCPSAVDEVTRLRLNMTRSPLCPW